MAILVTREAHCFEAILAGFKRGQFKEAEPVVVVGNRTDLKPLAEKHKLPFVHVPWNERAGAEEKLLALVEEHHVDFIVLARFMKILSPNVVWRFKNKIINIHPSLLPSFPGAQAYRQAYEHGVKIAGVTAHFVSMHLDEGPIISQGSFEIKPTMTLGEAVNPIGSFTDPEYAQVGMIEAQARAVHDVVVSTIHFDETTRTIIDGRTFGFCKLIVDRATHKILGCHVVGERAVEITQVAAIAITAGMRVDELAHIPLSFPTYAGILGRVAASVTRQLNLPDDWHTR
jgi:formyltetrahydrofolate hydrolase